MTIDVKFKLLHPDARTPTQGKEGDSGYDLYLPEGMYFLPNKPSVAKLGISIEIPLGYQGLILPRSSMFFKHQIVMVTGVLDSGYRGELSCAGFYLGDPEYAWPNDYKKFHAGDRVCQLVITPTMGGNVRWLETSLSKSERGATGFGSTGK